MIGFVCLLWKIFTDDESANIFRLFFVDGHQLCVEEYASINEELRIFKDGSTNFNNFYISINFLSNWNKWIRYIRCEQIHTIFCVSFYSITEWIALVYDKRKMSLYVCTCIWQVYIVFTMCMNSSSKPHEINLGIELRLWQHINKLPLSRIFVMLYTRKNMQMMWIINCENFSFDCETNEWTNKGPPKDWLANTNCSYL